MRLWPQTTTSDSAATQDSDSDSTWEVEQQKFLVHLCARGARTPNIKALLGKVQDGKIKEVNEIFHGARKGAKPRSLDYYTETTDRRRDASLIASLYRKMVRQNPGNSVRVFIQLHDRYLAHHKATPAYDIDEMIRLTCALDLMTLRAERCPTCGALILMQRNETAVEKVCFICNPNQTTKGSPRVSSAEPIQFPSPQKIAEVIAQTTAPMITAIELVKCGARPQEVELYVPGQELFARKLWPKLLGSTAPQGPHPFAVMYYTEKVERRRHAAFVIRTFQRLQKAGLQGAQLIVTTFRTYLSAFKGSAELMHFARVRGIVHFYLLQELRLVLCPECRAYYVILSDELAGMQSCPSCRQVGIAQRSDRPESSTCSKAARTHSSSALPLPGDVKRRRLRKTPPKTPVLAPGLN